MKTTERNIELNQEVLDYLDRENKNSLRVTLQGGGAWSGTKISPVVKVGQPIESQMEDYEVHEVDGLTVYLNRFMEFTGDDIVISYVKTPFAESLNVTGIY